MAVSVRPALDHELRACRLLLPQAFRANAAAEILVAADDGAVVGAIALGAAYQGSRPILVHVLPAWRRRGIGRALLAAVPAPLRSWTPLAETSDAVAFLAHCGFARHERIFHFETDVARFHAMMATLRQRVARRVPSDARIASLREVSPIGVADLIDREFPVAPAEVRRRLRPTAEDGYALDLSVALLVRDRLAGVLVYVWNDGVPVIEVRAVAPAFRGGWANILLLEAATARGLAAGAKRFRFYCDETVRDTVSLAKRADADLINTQIQLWRDRL